MGWDMQRFQHRIDGRAATMNQHRANPQLLELDQVTEHHLLVFEGTPPKFHHQNATFETWSNVNRVEIRSLRERIFPLLGLFYH
jgi:hypothetical protein